MKKRSKLNINTDIKFYPPPLEELNLKTRTQGTPECKQ